MSTAARHPVVLSEKAGSTEKVDSVASSAEDVAVAHSGVAMVEATHRVFGKYSKWALFISYVSPLLFVVFRYSFVYC